MAVPVGTTGTTGATAAGEQAANTNIKLQLKTTIRLNIVSSPGRHPGRHLLYA
jgi:hypothetical protein